MDKIVVNAKSGFVETVPLTPEEVAEAKKNLDVVERNKRNTLLKEEVDAIAGNALRWGALTPEQQQAWADYRQALLDVPQQDGFPETINWPVKPE